jgi:hypothetical protein
VSAVRQQINLYQPSGELRAGQHVGFAAAGNAVLLGAAVIAGLLGVWGFGVWRVQHLQRAVETLQREQQQQNETMAALGAARAAGISVEQLDATVRSLSLAVDTHARTLDLLRKGGAGGTSGFSARLSALARRPVAGLWLNHVVLSGLNGAMSVGGAALDPDLIPRYLHGLAAEQALANVRFDDFVIEQPSPVSGQEPSPSARPTTPQFNFRAESTSLRTAGADEHP